jgi:hypothetical protein
MAAHESPRMTKLYDRTKELRAARNFYISGRRARSRPLGMSG